MDSVARGGTLVVIRGNTAKPDMVDLDSSPYRFRVFAHSFYEQFLLFEGD
jgi:hypothetical protein